MKHVILTILKIVGVLLLALAVLIAGFLFWLSKRPFVPNHYTKTVEAGGEIEARYLAMGPCEVAQTRAVAPEDWEEFVAYYPAELEDSGERYPAVVFVNGTGVCASKYPALFRHLASWGFIVLGNQDPGTFSGFPARQNLGSSRSRSASSRSSRSAAVIPMEGSARCVFLWCTTFSLSTPTAVR